MNDTDLLHEFMCLQAENIALRNNLLLCKDFIEDKSRSTQRRKQILEILGSSGLTGGDKPLLIVTDNNNLVGYLTLAKTIFRAVESKAASAEQNNSRNYLL